MRSSLPAGVVGALLSLGTVLPATASDGRLEVNQACAQVGCFGGDGAGFPVSISAPGSYVLTSNLQVVGLFDGINAVSANGSVVIDLNGFEIDGTSTGDVGIRGGRRVVVKNGLVKNFTSDGIRVGDQSRVEAVVAEANQVYDAGLAGIATGRFSIVDGCTARMNFVGIQVGSSSIVERSSARSNRFEGIRSLATAFGVVVTGSVASDNEYGFGAGSGGVIRRSTAFSNRTDGIFAQAGNVLTDNSVGSNSRHGVVAAGPGCAVNRNTARANGGIGLYFLFASPSTAYRANTVTANAGGTVAGGVDMGENSCNGTEACP